MGGYGERPLGQCHRYHTKPNQRPEVEDAFWGGICMGLTDPFGNRLLFSEGEAS